MVSIKLFLIDKYSVSGKFYIHNDTSAPVKLGLGREEGKEGLDASNMMFVVVRNLKSQTNN